MPLTRIFTSDFDRFNVSNQIAVLLGRYLSSSQLLEAHGVLRLIERQGISSVEGYTWDTVRVREAMRITRLIMALNKGHKWALARLVEQVHPMLEPGIALPSYRRMIRGSWTLRYEGWLSSLLPRERVELTPRPVSFGIPR